MLPSEKFAGTFAAMRAQMQALADKRLGKRKAMLGSTLSEMGLTPDQIDRAFEEFGELPSDEELIAAVTSARGRRLLGITGRLTVETPVTGMGDASGDPGAIVSSSSSSSSSAAAAAAAVGARRSSSVMDDSDESSDVSSSESDYRSVEEGKTRGTPKKDRTRTSTPSTSVPTTPKRAATVLTGSSSATSPAQSTRSQAAAAGTTPTSKRSHSVKSDTRGKLPAGASLDLALTVDKLLWSEARQKAYEQIETNPNSYYYRFNAPGEKQRNGDWDEEERKLFFDRLKTHAPNQKWGVFSMVIPGRVGYQCSNFYRQLVLNGDIKDPAYSVGADGKLKFNRAIAAASKPQVTEGAEKAKPKARATRATAASTTRAKRASTRAASGESRDAKARAARVRKRNNSSTLQKRKRGDRENLFADEQDSDSDDDGQDMLTLVSRMSNRRRRTAHGVENPLPDLIDPITREPVVAPMMSPSGHVMGKESWTLSLLSSKNVCPLTKQQVKMSELVLLTKGNIDKYRDKLKFGLEG
jgi:hypothetical protein